MNCGQLFCYICCLIVVFSGLSFIGFTNLMIDKILSIQLTVSKQVTDRKSSTISANQEIKANNRWKIEKIKSDKKDCLSSCFGTTPKQRLPWKKTAVSLYNSNIVDVISVQK